jgi:4-amino-4-deoxy-L-arabinose transferase-like glycosyltransferase
MKRFFSITLPALLVGACLRLFFVLKFPATSGDTVLYDQLATNWLKLGKLAMDVNGQPTLVDLRMPGYPAFLAVIYAITGRTGEAARFPVMLAQIAVDLATCVIVAVLAALLARLAGHEEKANRAYIAALWLAALCPFTANYVAVNLTEVWAVFLTALAFLLLVMLASEACADFLPAMPGPFRQRGLWKLAALGGFVVGVGTLFRPETPLLLLTTFVVLGYWMVRRGRTRRLLQLCAVMALACGAALLPWIIRNAVTLHEFQPLAPKDATLPSEVDPKGFLAWEKTWLWRMRDAYMVTWKLNDEEIQIDDIPASAFDNEDERDRVAMVLERYNDETTWTAEEDAMFAQLAAERTARHPFRTYLWIPLRRTVVIWFSPRIELLPISGHVFPLAYQLEEDPVDQRMTILIFLVNLFYVGLGLCGAWKLRHYKSAQAAVAVLILYIIVRTAFLTTMETPEPRYVLVCFPALIALGAQVTWREKVSGTEETSKGRTGAA